MVEVKLTKTFIDNNTGKDIYVLSITILLVRKNSLKACSMALDQYSTTH